MASPVFINTEAMSTLLTHRALIAHLRASLPAASAALTAPPRQSHALSATASLLVMPAWSHHPSLPYVGAKLVTHFPASAPAVHAAYVLFCSATGRTLAALDGTPLTLLRTACVSALAAALLARPASASLALLGAGALAPHLVRAHLAATPALRRVTVWNRTPERAARLVDGLRGSTESEFPGIQFDVAGSVEEAVRGADIVTCATNSEAGLVEGRWLRSGAHLDLVGSFKPSMRECDDEAVRRGRVFVDNEVALVEAGELVGAFSRGVMREEDVCGTLMEVLKGERDGRRSEEEITVFKSVGSALVDILAAQLVYETYIQLND